MKRLLLLSNSTNPGEPYLAWPEKHIKDFLGKEIKKILFFPWAGVTISYDDYFNTVAGQLEKSGYAVESIHNIKNRSNLMERFDAVMIGGGNTFQLANMLQNENMMGPVREAVEKGLPFIGWSAGSNIACPTIKTTNDMPVAEPQSFNALNLIPFQINPHYTEATIPNHGGETRMMRIKEFLMLNRDVYVAGLPEGSLLRVENGSMYFAGDGPCKIFRYGVDTQLFKDGDDLSWLLNC